MLLIITPLEGWHREIQVYQFANGTEAEIFEAFQTVNQYYDEIGQREKVNIALVPITVDQLPDWIDNNIEPNWFEILRRKIRCSITTFAREA